MMKGIGCSSSIRQAGFKSKAQVSRLCGVDAKTVYNDFSNKKFKPNFYNYLRRAMDKQHMIERAEMDKRHNLERATMNNVIEEMQNV